MSAMPEIERPQAENTRLREALEKAVEAMAGYEDGECYCAEGEKPCVQCVLRKALQHARTLLTPSKPGAAD